MAASAPTEFAMAGFHVTVEFMSGEEVVFTVMPTTTIGEFKEQLKAGFSHVRTTSGFLGGEVHRTPLEGKMVGKRGAVLARSPCFA